MKNLNLLLVTITMLVISSCQKCGNLITNPLTLKKVVFQKSDGMVYSFDVQTTNPGYILYADNMHNLQIKAVNGSTRTAGSGNVKGYVVGNGADTFSVVNFTFQDYNIGSPNAMEYIIGMQSTTSDTTKTYNLGNVAYDLSGSPIFSVSGTQPSDYYYQFGSGVKDSLHTSVSGVYDTSVTCIFNPHSGTPLTNNGDHYYAYPEDLSLWMIECSIRFANVNFNDISTYLPIQSSYLHLDGMTYYKNGTVTAQYNFKYTENSSNWTVTKKVITDNNGNTSSITFVYN